MKVAYNITYVVDRRIVDRWRLWMVKVHLPDLIKTGCFESFRLHKLIALPSADEPTYSVQLIIQSKSELKRYQDRYEEIHIQHMQRHFQNSVVEFRTTMVIIEEG